MNILFDLDGTLTDSALGITRCIQHALKELGRPIPPMEDLYSCIGPPLITSFLGVLGVSDEAEAQRGVELYRTRYLSKGKFENRVYDGIMETLHILQQRHTLFVATAKPHIQALPILDHFKLSPHFTNMYGSELNGRNSEKTELIATIIKKEGLDPEDTVMIGDRQYDMIGASNNKVTAIGVSYGFGSIEELRNAGALHIVDSPQAIPDLIESLSKTTV